MGAARRMGTARPIGGSRPAGERRLPVAALVALAVLATGTLGLGRPRLVRGYPMWRVAAGAVAETTRGCANAGLRVAKSGKTGVGVVLTLQLAEGADGCAVSLEAVSLTVGEVRAEADVGGGEAAGDEAGDAEARAATGGAARTVQLSADEPTVRRYLPLPFDNEGLWNRGLRAGRFTVALRVDGAPAEPWVLPAEHVLEGALIRERRPDEPCRADLEELQRLQDGAR